MAHPQLDEGIRLRLVRVAIEGSTLRGRGNGGAVQAARAYVRQLDVRKFAVASERRFASALDKSTAELLESLPRGARHWGLARKALNIFLRDCLYSRQMCDRFPLLNAAAFFEIPLDGIVGRRLCALDGGLPRWQSIRSLSPERSAKYQEAAGRAAAEMAIARVDLDAIWWSEETGPRG